jgi:hypothetical protein
MNLQLPFAPGQLVVVILHSPRERLWGALLGLEAPGLALRGIDVLPWEEVLSLVRQGLGDQVSLSTRFVPMYRIESLYLDERSSGVPGLGEVFLARTGIDPIRFLLGEGQP